MSKRIKHIGMFFPTLHLGNDALYEKLCILIVKVCSTSSEQIITEMSEWTQHVIFQYSR